MSDLSWKLDDGVERNRQNPETFWIPSAQEPTRLAAGFESFSTSVLL
jgi:hypothetical protein